MQRLARVGLDQYHQDVIDLFSHYDDIVALLNHHLPPSTATMLARPEIHGEAVEWYSDLQGQPYLLEGNSAADLNAREAAKKLIDSRLRDIDALCRDLQQKGAIAVELSNHLKKLIDLISNHEIQIYLVNNQPVITGWGLRKNTTPEPPPTPVKSKSLRAWLWLPLLLLLLFTGFLLWWFYFRPQTAPTEPVVPPAPKHCRKVENYQDIPQLAIIFNNASGMKYTLLESKASIKAFDDKLLEQRLPQQEIDYMDRQPNRSVAAKEAVNHLINDIPNAIDIGLIELQSCVSKSPDVSAVINHGIFHNAQRNQLKEKVKNMNVRDHRVPGTPIYEGLEKALTLLDGKQREALIVLITEGNGDCTERKLCALIEDVVEQRPKLKVNIVNINSPWNATDCLAKATGGQIFEHDMTSQEKLTDAIKQAMKPVQQEICE